MGIPTFFRSILQKNKNIIMGATNSHEVDYLFIDFNSLIYNTWNKIHKKLEKNDEEFIHSSLIRETIYITSHIINDIVQPKKYAYLSLDGSAPRAKMIQQRSRRYKSVQLKELFKKKRMEFNVEKTIEWDPSPNICPGTIFMEKLAKELRIAMKNKEFHCQVFLSDASIAGEGEHKFLKRIRKIHQDEKTKDDSIVIYSPDGDMISLALLTHKKNIFIMRIPDEKSLHEARFCNDFEFIYCDLNLVRNDFFNVLTQTYQDNAIDELRVLNDYNFLLFMVGNDFVSSLPFLKIRSGGLDILIRIYNDIRPQIGDYLISYHPIHQKKPILNMKFFSMIILKLSQIENSEMMKEYQQYQKELAGGNNFHRSANEKDMSPYQIFESRYQHLCFFNPLHPEHEKYCSLIQKIDYRKPKHEWKSQYYKHFFDLDSSDTQKYNDGRTRIVMNYFESLMFTLRYYLTGCPCFEWHYKYRASPIPSDMMTVLTKYNFDLNDIQFKNAQPYAPLEQLMFILPPQMSFLVPSCLQKIMKECHEFYPKTFEIDALAGSKYIYSEAILPEIDTTILKEKIMNKLDELSEAEKRRNTISTKLIFTKL